MYGKYIMSRKFILSLSIIFAVAGFFFARVPLSPAALAWSPLFMIFLATPALVGLCFWQGWKRALIIFTMLSVFGFAIESLGVATGFPYGEFYYHEALGFRVFGLVPWTLPLGWVPLVIGAAYLTRSITPLWQRVVLGASILVGADLVLDPGAVYMHFWTWAQGGIYYGVPFTNFLGWVLSGSVGLFLMNFFVRTTENSRHVLVPLSEYSLLLTLAFWAGFAVSIAYWVAFLLASFCMYFSYMLIGCLSRRKEH
jgi:putative membrane protein